MRKTFGDFAGNIARSFAFIALAGSAHAQSIDGTCDQVSPTAAACIGADKLAEAASAECRRIGLPDANCALPLGHHVSSQIVSAYQGTWLHRAAAFQYSLGNAVPLGQTQFLGTHNSFNSVNDSPTPSHTDSNQQLSLTQQLDIDMRALELDLHFVPSLAAGGSKPQPLGAHFIVVTTQFKCGRPESRAWSPGTAEPSHVKD